MHPKWRLNRAANLLIQDLKSRLDAISPDLITPVRKPTRDITLYQAGIELCAELARLHPPRYGYIYIHYRDKIDRRARKRCSLNSYFNFLVSSSNTIKTTYEMIKHVSIQTINNEIDLIKPLEAIELDVMKFAQDNLNVIVPAYLDIIPTKAVQGFIQVKNNQLEFLFVESNESLVDRFPVTATIETSQIYHKFIFDVFVMRNNQQEIIV